MSFSRYARGHTDRQTDRTTRLSQYSTPQGGTGNAVNDTRERDRDKLNLTARCRIKYTVAVGIGLNSCGVRIDVVALQREEEKATQVIRQAARNGQTQGCHNIAVAIANSRKMCRRLQTVKFRLDSVEINLQQQRCNALFIPLNCDNGKDKWPK